MILDVGCGMGLALGFLHQAGFSNLKGIDSDVGQVRLAQESHLPAIHVPDTVGYLKGKMATADTVLCLDVLEHIPKKIQIDFLGAIFQALKPGGRLLLTVPNANSSLANRWRYNDWTHELSFTEHSLDFVLYHAGFRTITVSPAEFIQRPRFFFLPVAGSRHWWAFRFFRFLRRMEMMAELGPDQGRQVPLSLNLLAVADKAVGG